MVPTVSVILSVYNGAAYIAEAVNSILEQTYTDFEFIIIDDGSDDGTPRIIAAYDDARIQSLRNPNNIGLTRSLNRGLDEATGTYIARMDADDIALPRRLEMQVAYMEAHPDIAALGTAYEIMTPAGTRMVRPYSRHELLQVVQLFTPPIAHPTAILRTTFLKEHRLRYDPAFRCSQDYDLWSRLLACPGARIANLSEPLLRHRVHPNRVTAKLKECQMDTALKVRPREIRRLGLEPGEQEIELHNRLADGPLLETMEDIWDVANWIEQLTAANILHRHFEQDAFEQVLSAQWSKVCSQNTQLGLPLFTTWLTSSHNRGISLAESLKMLAKCILRWAPHRKQGKESE